MEIRDKIVDFEKYCETCKYKDYPEGAIPCCDCLNYPTNQNSRIPVEYERSEKTVQKKKIQQERRLLQPRMRVPKKVARTAVVDSDNVMGKIKEMQSK